MVFSLVSASVSGTASVTTFNINTSHPKNEAAAQAINIGNLDEESSTIQVSDQGAAAGSAVSTTFTANAGDVASLSQAFGNIVDQAATRFQLFDSSGAVVADNQGTVAQQQAYAQWVAGDLSLNGDTYTAIATPGFNDTALAISSAQQQGTSLQVNSQLTGGDTAEYYNFSLSGGNLKLAFDAGAQQSSTRVQILDADGNVVADSAGNSFEQSNYQQITSGIGLAAASGNYTVEVSYAPGADITQNINYNFQLYSGSTYSVIYDNTIAAQPADFSAAGSVTATSNAQAYSRQGFNKINETAAGAVNIGWLQENKSSLNVLSQLTNADNADFYSFTLQAGDNLKFGFDATQTPDASALRVQLYDISGTYVIADNYGTAAQRAAYQSLTTSNGLSSKPGTYIAKISYAPGVTESTQNYEFNIFSGTSYAAQYKTIASAQTYGNALLSGNVGGGASAALALASYLSGNSAADVISVLSEYA